MHQLNSGDCRYGEEEQAECEFFFIVGDGELKWTTWSLLVSGYISIGPNMRHLYTSRDVTCVECVCGVWEQTAILKRYQQIHNTRTTTRTVGRPPIMGYFSSIFYGTSKLGHFSTPFSPQRHVSKHLSIFHLLNDSALLACCSYSLGPGSGFVQLLPVQVQLMSVNCEYLYSCCTLGAVQSVSHIQQSHSTVLWLNCLIQRLLANSDSMYSSIRV